MSHLKYDLLWNEAMTELLEQVHVENMPGEIEEGGTNAAADNMLKDDWFQHSANLYANQIQIQKKLETCYDQIVQPQKRIEIKKTLECTLARVIELKRDMIKLNPRLNSEQVQLDSLLIDLKMGPDTLDIPVPKQFLEDNEESEERRQLLDKLLISNYGSCDPEEDVEEETEIDVNFEFAIRLIQKNERGRQGRKRALDVMELYRKKMKIEEKRKLMAEGKEFREEDEKNDAILIIQKCFKAFKARRIIDQLRFEELVFLGMAPNPTGKKEQIKREEVRELRKMQQSEYQRDQEQALEDISETVRKNEAPDIKEELLEQRRQWVLEVRKKAENAIPSELDGFYKQEEEERRLREGIDDEKEEEVETKTVKEKTDKNKKEKTDKKEGKKSKKTKTKKNIEATDEEQTGGPTQLTCELDHLVGDYTDQWENLEENENTTQKYDTELAKKTVRPDIIETIRELVDKQILEELDVMKSQLDTGGKKKPKKPKKPGKSKKQKSGSKKKKKLPGEAVVEGRQVQDLIAGLVDDGILRKRVPATLDDFVGDFNYLGSLQAQLGGVAPAPCIQQLKQMITEHVILPLGSASIRAKIVKPLKSILFYGPSGTGKTMMARAIAYLTQSYFIDLSPYIIEGKQIEKKGPEILIATCFKIAREKGPVVIYIDDVEQMLAGGGGKKAKKVKKSSNSANRIKKDLVTHKKAADETCRFIIVGTTNKPWDTTKKEIESVFDKIIQFPFPQQSSLKTIWKHQLEKAGAIITPSLRLTVLAEISLGYTPGSIKKAIDKVLTLRRKYQLEKRPLRIQEFLGPLSKTEMTYKTENTLFESCSLDFSGDRLREEQAKKASKTENEETDKKNKPKPKK